MTSLTEKCLQLLSRQKQCHKSPPLWLLAAQLASSRKRFLGCWCSLSLYQPGELEGVCRRVTEPVCSLQAYRLRGAVPTHSKPVLYYLLDGPTRGFVREEVHVVLLTFSCRRKTVSNSLVASLRSSSVVAIS